MTSDRCDAAHPMLQHERTYVAGGCSQTTRMMHKLNTVKHESVSRNHNLYTRAEARMCHTKARVNWKRVAQTVAGPKTPSRWSGDGSDLAQG
jgi:hypothetical protein